MKPIGKYIVVNTIHEEVKTDSGLLLSGEDMTDMRYRKAKVVEPGSDVTVIKKGDVIYYDSRTGYTMFINNEQYTIIIERDVVVVV